MTIGEHGTLDTLPKLLLHHSADRGGRPAFREKARGIWRTTTWRQFADETAAIAAALSAQGLRRGAHAAFVGDNRPRLYIAMCAAQCLGAIAVPLYQDAAADEMAEAIRSAEATDVFAENQEQVDKILEILPRCPSVRRIIYDKDRGMRHYRQPQLLSYAFLLQQGRGLAAAKRDAVSAEAARGSGEDAAFLFFTSGTTGPPKGVVLDHASLIDRARTIVSAEGVTEADVAMAYLPPGWIGQNLFGYVQPMVAGYCVCCPESSETMLADMREIGPTYFLATPRVLKALMTQVDMRLEDTGGINRLLYRRGLDVARRTKARLSPADRLVAAASEPLIFGPLRDVLGMSRIRVAYSAGDAVDPGLVAYFRAIGVNLKQLYGSTETGFIVAVPPDGAVEPGTVGPAAGGVELRFTPEREILVRSPGLFKEYHRDREATERARDWDGWFRTGDVGYLGRDGHLRIVDRARHVGTLEDGSPFAPKALESKLKLFTFVREAVVFGSGRPAACALVDVDAAAVGRWADKRAISYTGHADLASREEVHDLVASCIAEVNAALARDPALARSQIRRFAIVPREMDAEDGLLTRTGKLRREAVAERYGPLIEAMHAGRSEVGLHGIGGPESAGPVQVKIRDAKLAASAPDRKAA